ncbi:MAG: sugar phosphate isomerase/epimerase family protein [Gaiellales bacterium]
MRAASAPVSFGVFEMTADDAGLPDPDRVLDAMASAGYEGTELGPPGYFGDGAGAAGALDQRGLALAGSFLPLRLSRAERAAEDTAYLDATLTLLDESTPAERGRPVVLLSDAFEEPERMAGAGRIEQLPDTWLSDARFSTLVDAAHRAAERCRDRGYEVAFHYHGGTYVETPREIDRFVQQLDRSLLGLCYDSGHSMFGGGDPVAFLREYGELVTHVHIKDVDAAVMEEIRTRGLGLEEAWRRGVFCLFGEGGVDLAAVAEELRRLGFDGWVVVEQDRYLKPGQTVESLQADAEHNLEYLRGVGF